MGFNLLGFDWIKSDNIYGFWCCSVKNWKDIHRSLLCIHYSEGEWRVELCWVKLI